MYWSIDRVKHLRVTINVAVTVAMMLPTGIFAECCCSSSKIGCCAVEAPTETPKSKCCSCEQRLAEQESLLECVTLKIENQDRSSCECCLKVRQNSSAVRGQSKNVDLDCSAVDYISIDDCSLHTCSVKRLETASPAISNNRRQAILCVWTH